MPMSEEDEVFLEKSFQRTLIVSLLFNIRLSKGERGEGVHWARTES